MDYTLPHIIVFIALGVCAGALSGFFGIGGGIVIVPGLVLAFHMEQHLAQAASIAVLCLPVALPSFLQYYKKERKKISLHNILFTVLGVSIGGFLGATSAAYIPSFWLRKIFGIFLLYQCFIVFYKTFYAHKKTSSPTSSLPKKIPSYIFVFIGIATGLLSGLVGIGGTLVLIPLLILIGYSQHQAQGFSLGILSIPLGAITSFLVYHEHGFTELHPPLFIALGFLLGSFLTTRIALRLPTVTLKRYFYIFVFLNAIYLLLK